MISRSNTGPISSGRNEERALHRLDKMEGSLSTLNKMINRSEAGQEATACLSGKSSPSKSNTSQNPAANTSLTPTEVASVAGEKAKEEWSTRIMGPRS